MEVTEAEKIIRELFSAGVTMFILSLFINIFNPQVAKMLKSISYMCIAFFVLAIVFQAWGTVNNLIETLNNLANWKPDLNPLN